MTVAADTEITNLDRMWPDVADRRRPHEKAIAIELNAAPIIVVMKAALNRVCLANKILAKDVGDVNILMARVEAIQAAVGVFLQHRKVRTIELVTIIVKRTKHARAEVVIGENEPAEVGNKRLDTGAHGNEVVIRVEVGEFHLTKRLFE